MRGFSDRITDVHIPRHPVFLAGALYPVCAGAIRLAYFNIHGLREDGTYAGVPIGLDIILTPLVFLLHGSLGMQGFRWLVCLAIVLGDPLNIAPIRFAKLAGPWYVAVASFVLILSVYYLVQLR